MKYANRYKCGEFLFLYADGSYFPQTGPWMVLYYPRPRGIVVYPNVRYDEHVVEELADLDEFVRGCYEYVGIEQES
jgi:hypothetical protein